MSAIKQLAPALFRARETELRAADKAAARHGVGRPR
jgi:hypothetical protein